MARDRDDIRHAPLWVGTPPLAMANRRGGLSAAPGAVPTELIVKGQGVIEITSAAPQAPLRLTLSPAAGATGTAGAAGANRIHLEVSPVGVRIHDDHGEIEARSDSAGAGLDRDPSCLYWFSLDAQNRRLRYGKGEVRLDTLLLEAPIPGPVGQRQEPGLWVFELSRLECENVASATIWRDPLTAPLPLLVIPTDAMTLDTVASHGAIVAADLAVEAQRLHGTISGRLFRLDTPDFPDFSAAIEASIADPEGWCHRTLAAKASEFGQPDPLATYLRITLGVNQGESPGIPYVLEIWPPDHRSPIHNHAGAHAVIRVLHGAITVSLYPMLSTEHQTPFASQVFETGSVTWISPRLNQTHRLHNANIKGPTCITIQCYAYGSLDDRAHYEYFDYIDNSGQAIGHFDPNSDMDFVAFKALMQKEWQTRGERGG